MVLPFEQCCISAGDARSASFASDIERYSLRPVVRPPAPDPGELTGCVTPHWAWLISIQPWCVESVDSPLMPSICKYASIAMVYSPVIN